MTGSTEQWLGTDSGARQLGLQSSSATSQQYVEQTDLKPQFPLMQQEDNYTYLTVLL